MRDVQDYTSEGRAVRVWGAGARLLPYTCRRKGSSRDVWPGGRKRRAKGWCIPTKYVRPGSSHFLFDHNTQEHIMRHDEHCKHVYISRSAGKKLTRALCATNDCCRSPHRHTSITHLGPIALKYRTRDLSPFPTVRTRTSGSAGRECARPPPVAARCRPQPPLWPPFSPPFRLPPPPRARRTSPNRA